MADLLPLKSRILYYASREKEEFTVQDVMKDLKDDYGADGQFNKKMITHHLDSLRAVGMLETNEAGFDSSGELVIKYKATDYGRSRMVYMPDKWRDSKPKYDISQ